MEAPPYRILFIEDHADTRIAAVRLLKQRGHEVKSAETCADALEMAKREPFDLLIADVGLPDGSGLELLGSIRRLYPIRGIVLTGNRDFEDIERTRQAGFARHMTKPMLSDNLCHVINEVMADEGDAASAESSAPAHDRMAFPPEPAREGHPHPDAT